MQGDFEKAINDYSVAIRIDPNHFKAVYNRAFSYDKVSSEICSLFVNCIIFFLLYLFFPFKFETGRWESCKKHSTITRGQ